MDFSTYSDNDLESLRVQVQDEQAARAVKVQTRLALASLNVDTLVSRGGAPGQGWRAPAHALEAYPKDWVVTYKGKRWQSQNDWNMDEPGTSDTWYETDYLDTTTITTRDQL